MVLCYGSPRKQIKDVYLRLSSTRQAQGLAEDVAGKKTTNPFKIQTGYYTDSVRKSSQRCQLPVAQAQGDTKTKGGTEAWNLNAGAHATEEPHAS